MAAESIVRSEGVEGVAFGLLVAFGPEMRLMEIVGKSRCVWSCKEWGIFGSRF